MAEALVNLLSLLGSSDLLEYCVPARAAPAAGDKQHEHGATASAASHKRELTLWRFDQTYQWAKQITKSPFAAATASPKQAAKDAAGGYLVPPVYLQDKYIDALNALDAKVEKLFHLSKLDG
jgi:hypothetical protein